jgi:hypothetical protein
MLRCPAFLGVIALALVACDSILGIEPWSSEPRGEGGGTEGGGGSGASSVGGGGATSTGEGGSSCDGALERCGEECVDLAQSSLHCGSCDRSCFGGSCSEGVCAVAELANEGFIGGLARVATTSDWIAWTAPSGTVRALRKSDAQVETLTSGLSSIRALAGGGQSFVFADSPDTNGNARVHRAEPSGGLPTIIAQGPDASSQDLLVDGATVFSAGGGTTSTLGVYSFPLNGVASAPSLVCGNSVSVSSGDLAVNGTYVYFRRSGSGNLAHVCSKSAGGTPGTVSQNAVNALAADAELVYFAYGSSIYSRAFPMLGEALFLTAPAQVAEIEVSSSRIAWRSGANVYFADKVIGASPTLIATEASNVADLALDEDGLYWITNQGVVRALAF